MKIFKRVLTRCGSMLLAAALLTTLAPASVFKASAYSLDAVEISPGLSISAKDNVSNTDEADYAEWDADLGEFNFNVDSLSVCGGNTGNPNTGAAAATMSIVALLGAAFLVSKKSK